MLIQTKELAFTVVRDGFLTSKRPGLIAKIDGVPKMIDGRVPVRQGQRIVWTEIEARGTGDLLFHFADR